MNELLIHFDVEWRYFGKRMEGKRCMLTSNDCWPRMIRVIRAHGSKVTTT